MIKKSILPALLLATISVPALAASPDAAQSPVPHEHRAPPTAEEIKTHLEAHLAKIEEALKPTASLKADWDSYKVAIEKDIKAPPARPDHKPTLPERLAHEEEMAKEHVSRIENIKPVLEKLYADASAEQKKILDDSRLPGVGGGHPPHGPHDRNGPPGGPKFASPIVEPAEHTESM